MADTEKLMTQEMLSLEKRRLFEQWLETEGIRSKPNTLLSDRRKDYSELPLSFAQRRLWFLDQLEPGSPFYNLPHPVRLSGKLDINVLEASLNHVIQRHEPLRTTFHEENGRPFQRIAERLELKVSITDLSHWPESKRTEETERLAVEEARAPFDLRHGPVLRARLLRLGAEDHLLLLTMHHIISDGWSLDIFVRETAAFYEATLAGEDPALEPLPIQYADYALWQLEQIQRGALDREIQYWRRQLGGAIVPLEFPADYPRPRIQRYRGAQCRLSLNGELTASFMAFTRREDVTLFMLLLAAWKLLLHRYSGGEDIVVGIPIAGRTRPEIEPLIGYFANTLALRTSLEGDPAARELLRKVRETALGAYAHQDLPFEKLLEDLQPARDPSRQPLFQTVFTLQNLPRSDYALLDLTISPMDVDTGTSKFDLTLMAQEERSGLELTLEYNTGLFNGSTANRLLRHFQNIVCGLAEGPDRRISEIPLLDAKEKEQFINEARKKSEYAVDRTLVDLFEAQVRLRPQALAAGLNDEWLTYQELNNRANRLAHYLLRRGIRSGTLVGILLERTVDIVVSILGILKAGGAYLPIDPAYPPERVAFMLSDSGAAAVLVHRELLDRLRPSPFQAICLEDQWGRIECEDETSPEQSIAPCQAAYVIYTSGSTGQPKGVVVSHANVVRLFRATQSLFNFHHDDVWTLFHSCAFDFSVWEIWGALLYGGRLAIVPFWVSRSPDLFLELLEKEKVTILNQTPSAFQQLIQAEAALPRKPELQLREVIFGGEALHFSMLRPWVERHGSHPRLVNMYGITETTVHVTHRPLTKEDIEHPEESRIGVALPDLEIYILDRHMEPMPPGAAGEIYVGGAGVAPGYLGRPELTAERFVPNPFSAKPGERLYKTGDTGRRRTGGDLEYAGRIDHQVKIRGFRIELGEIEGVFRRHPHVRDCVATLQESGPGEKRLVLHVVAADGQLPAINDLWRYAGDTLPEYMLPASVVYLDTLPLTAHGKVDRRALPFAEHVRPALDERYVAPANEMESVLAEIWSQVLELERVGVEDNFFRLGADSIRSIEVRARAQSRGLNVSIPELFQHQTIRALALHLKDAGKTAPLTHVQPFSLIAEEDRGKLPAGLEDAYPLSGLQAGLIFQSEYSPDYLIYITTFHLRARFDFSMLRKAIDEVTGRHPMLRTSFATGDYSEPLQFVHREATMPLEMEDLRHLSAAEQEARITAWMEAEKVRKFDWSAVPLFRAHVHRRGENDFQFSLSEPFLDGWSVASLITEIFERYLALLKGNSLPAAPLRSSYADFVDLERQSIASEETRRYWLKKFSDVRASRVTGGAYQHKQGGTPGVGRTDVQISDSTSRGLRDLAMASGLSIKSVLLAAHCKVVSVLSGQSEVVTGLFLNGRPELEDGDKVIGIFVNTLPLKVALRTETWAELAHRVSEEEGQLLPHRRYTIQHLQRLCGVEDLFDTIFNYTHFYVYQRLLNSSEVEGISMTGTEQTYYALTAQFSVDQTSLQITLALDYRELAVSRADAEKIAGYYSRVLEAMAESPFQSHDSICFLSQAEQDQVLARWNHTFMDYEKEESFLALFEKQAELVPHAPAAICGEGQIAYCELNDRANQLGRYLRSLGVGPETLVGICVGRTTQMLIGLLGILKSGGVYVPLDPQYPPEQLQSMLDDTQVRVLVTVSALKESLIQGAEHVICLDSDWPSIALESTANVHSGVTAANLACLVYTAGATGKPRCVGIEHRNTLGLMHWAHREFGKETLAGVLAASTIHSARAILEIYAPLCWGGTVIMAEDLFQLQGLAAKNSVTLISAAPPAMAELSCSDWVPETAKALLIAGEALPGAMVDRIFEAASIKKIWNLYGLSEDAGCTTAALVEKGTNSLVTIGRPVANRQLYVLSQQLQPVPEGVAGELHVSGEGLARGYAGRPEMTAERFIPNPFSGAPGARMHRTGDLVRYHFDGKLEYLGRIDHQSRVIANGQPALPDAAAEFIPEENLAASPVFIQELLAGIWAEVLKLERVGIHDDFFDSGGHSLNITQVISRARDIFHIELHVLDLFSSPTIADFAAIVAEKLREGKPQVPPLRPAAGNGCPPLSFAQQRLWFIDQLESGSPFYNIPTAVRLSGELDAAVLQKCVNEIIRRHAVLRTGFPGKDRQPAQVIVPELALPVEIHDLTHLSSEEKDAQIQRQANEEVQRPFKLEQAPLLRIHLFRLAPREHILLAVMHHIVSDGWSMGVLVRELTELYAAFLEGKPSPLPDLEIQYSDYAAWQREWLSGEVLHAEHGHWKARLAGAPPVLVLPTDRDYPEKQTYRGKKHVFTLSYSITAALRPMITHENVTLFMAMLAAYKVLLCHYTRQTDMVVGTAVAGRTRSEVEPLIGFFVNTLPLRTDLSGDPDFHELLQRIREVCLDAYAHQDLPFDKLVEELQPRRDPAHPPIVQVMFVLENAPLSALELPGLMVAPVEVESGSAKFPLTLLAYEAEESITCLFEYNTALFDEQTISRMAGDYAMVLEKVTKQPSVRISEIDEALAERAREEKRRQEAGYDEAVRGKLKDMARRVAG